MKQVIAILLSPILAGLLTAASPPSSAPEWLAGSWTETKGERWTEEYWTGMRGGIMLGGGRSGKGDQLRDWEALRITRDADGGLTYWASPKGAPAVAFKVVSASGTEIIFANPAHDYPQRIRYWRSGKILNAEISLADGSKAIRWSYSPAARPR